MKSTSKIKKVYSLTLVFTLLLAGCSSAHTIRTGKYDHTQKIVYIQPGQLRILYYIKETFRENGWEIEEYERENARYMVHLNTKSTQMLCLNEFSEMEVELLLLDMKNRSQIFAIESKTCDTYSNLRKELHNALRE